MVGEHGIIGKAIETTKIYAGSNTVKRYDAIVEGNTIQNFANYVKENLGVTCGISMDTKAAENLEKYNITKITPTRRLGEIENPFELYLITDEYGHDIGTYQITEKGPIFKLAPSIEKYNKNIIENSGFSKDEQKLLEAEFDVKSLEGVTRKLAKGEDLLIENKEKAKSVIREKIAEEYARQGMKIEGSKPEMSPEEKEEIKEQQRIIARVPADMRDEVYDFINKSGAKIKEVLVIDNPKQLAGRIDNRKNQIKEHGGPVVLIKTAHRGADSIGDDVYTIQDGQPAKQDEANDMILKNVMDNHKDEAHVRDLDEDDSSTLSEKDSQAIIDENARKAAIAQEIIEKTKKEIEIETEEALRLAGEAEYAEEPTKSEMLADANSHKEKVEIIKAERETVLSGLMDRDPEYKLDGSDKENELEDVENIVESESDNRDEEEEIERSIQEQEEKEETDDEEPVRNRWEEADPYDQHKNGNV